MCFLVNRDGWGEPFDLIDVWLLHLPQELPRVCRERLNIPTLSLGKDRIKCQARLPRAGYAGETDKFIARQLKRNILEIMLPRAFDDDFILHSGLQFFCFLILQNQSLLFCTLNTHQHWKTLEEF